MAHGSTVDEAKDGINLNSRRMPGIAAENVEEK
jgi:hypothetical protein